MEKVVNNRSTPKREEEVNKENNIWNPPEE